jgi:1-phosphofructokinase family hexose kinase
MIYTLTLNPAVDKEYTVPRLVIDEVLRASEVRVDHGGKGFNVSRMLAALGTPSTAVGLVGGHTGDLLCDGLEDAGIYTDFVNVNGETRTNISIVDENLVHHIKVNESGPLVSEDEINTLIIKISNLVKSGDYWVLAGSLPPGAPKDIYAQIIRIVQKGGARAILDSSGEPLLLGCQAGPYLAKPNASEASQVTGKPAETLFDMARLTPELHSMGVKVVVISAGKKGALLSDGNKQWFGHTPVIEEHNPIGAGDAMVAGLVWKLAKCEEPSIALRWGLACGAAAASQPGTGMASKEIIESLFPKTRLEIVKNAL